MNTINHGVIEGRKDTDYVSGVLPYFIRLPDGNWEKFAPPGARQWNSKGDNLSCVSHSDVESIQTQQKFLTGQAPKYSIRWVAKMSRTTKKGNRLDFVADAVRKYGLVPYEMYPDPQEPWTWENYHADIPEPLMSQLLAEGQRWLQQWSVMYEWVDIYWGGVENIKKQLMQAPLQVVIPGHAILEIRNLNDYFRYLDTYEPFIKEKPQNAISSAMKILLTPLKGQRMSNAKLVKVAGGKGYGWYLEDINPSALISSGLHFGREIPKNPDGSVNFAEVDKMVEGEVTLK